MNKKIMDKNLNGIKKMSFNDILNDLTRQINESEVIFKKFKEDKNVEELVYSFRKIKRLDNNFHLEDKLDKENKKIVLERVINNLKTLNEKWDLFTKILDDSREFLKDDENEKMATLWFNLGIFLITIEKLYKSFKPYLK